MDPYGSAYGGSYGGGSYGSYGLSAPTTTTSSAPSSLKKWMWYAICLLLVGAGTYLYLRTKQPGSSEDTGGDIGGGTDDEETRGKKRKALAKSDAKAQKNASPKTASGGGDIDTRTDFEKERDWVKDAPVAKLAAFAFESKTKSGYVPNKSGAIAPKPAGNPPYKFVACEASASYAIRWNGRYLTVKSPNSVKWTEERQEPHSCFKTVPGYCGAGNGYVMLRSVANKMFVRADASSGLLVCKDTPTARTADAYCWKLNPDAVPAKKPCGQQYSYDLGRIVDVPCDVKEMPSGNDSCSTVTNGYQASCCIRKGPGAHDAFCEATIFPKVVGQQLQQALLYIRTRRPDLTLKPCPEPCTTQAVPEQYPNVVIVPYDARSGYVTSIPRRLV